MTTLNIPSDDLRHKLRNAGWSYHLRLLRGTFEVFRPGETYIFHLDDEFDVRYLDEFVANLKPASTVSREDLEHMAACAGVNNVEGLGNDQLKAAILGALQ